MKTTEIELAGKCIEYCRKKLFVLRRLKARWLAADAGDGNWSESMAIELQRLEAIFAESTKDEDDR